MEIVLQVENEDASSLKNFANSNLEVNYNF